MGKLFVMLVVIAVAGCSALPRPYDAAASPCAISKASYDCQVEMYQMLP